MQGVVAEPTTTHSLTHMQNFSSHIARLSHQHDLTYLALGLCNPASCFSSPAAKRPSCRLGERKGALVCLSPPVYSQESIKRTGPVMGSWWSVCVSPARSLVAWKRAGASWTAAPLLAAPLCPAPIGLLLNVKTCPILTA